MPYVKPRRPYPASFQWSRSVSPVHPLRARSSLPECRSVLRDPHLLLAALASTSPALQFLPVACTISYLFFLLCLSISYNMIEVAHATFREEAEPYIGIVTVVSHRSW